MIRRFHEARRDGIDTVTVWGTGTPRREFLYADDLAEGCLHLLKQAAPPSVVNIGYGSDITILELAKEIAEVVGFDGQITFDESKPDGTPRKLMDSSKIQSLGWRAATTLREGLRLAYEDFQRQPKEDYIP